MAVVPDVGSAIPKKKVGVPASQADPWMFPIKGLVTQNNVPVNPVVKPPSSTPVPPVPGPAGNITLPGVNWRDQIFGDPGYIAGHAGIEANKANALTALQTNARAALVRLGYLPPNFQDKYGVIDQASIDAAKQNPNSVAAQLQRMYETNITNINNRNEEGGNFNLEAGAAAQGRNIEGVAAGGRTQDAIDSFLGAVYGYGTDYGNALGAAGQAEGDLINNTGTKLSQDPSLSGAPTTATLLPGSTAQYGHPVYKAPNGKLYTADGKEFVPPGAKPQIDPATGLPTYGWSGMGVGGI